MTHHLHRALTLECYSLRGLGNGKRNAWLWEPRLHQKSPRNFMESRDLPTNQGDKKPYVQPTRNFGGNGSLTHGFLQPSYSMVAGRVCLTMTTRIVKMQNNAKQTCFKFVDRDPFLRIHLPWFKHLKIVARWEAAAIAYDDSIALGS